MGPPARQLWDPTSGPTSDGAAAGEVATRPTAALMEVAMAFREVRVYEIKDNAARQIMRRWWAPFDDLRSEQRGSLVGDAALSADG
jgi:hypothetical protein